MGSKMGGRLTEHNKLTKKGGKERQTATGWSDRQNSYSLGTGEGPGLQPAMRSSRSGPVIFKGILMKGILSIM